MQVHLVPILLDRGYAPTFAAALAGLIGAMQVLGRILMVPLAGHLRLHTLSAVVLALQPIALVVLLLVPGTLGVLVFVAVFGTAKGCMTLVRPAFAAELYGRTHYASIAGVLAFAATLAQAVAPVGAGVAYDTLGGYDPILWCFVGVSAMAVVTLLPVRAESTPVPRAKTDTTITV